MITLHENERIISLNRKAWIVFATAYAAGASFFVLPFILAPTLGAFFPILRVPPLLNVVALLSILWWWGIWVWLFWALAKYYLDIFIVTNERVVHIEQHGLFNRSISEARLSRVQDINIKIEGFLPTMLHYGDIRIQSAAEISEFIFRQVQYPEKLKEQIMEQHRLATAKEHAIGAMPQAIPQK